MSMDSKGRALDTIFDPAFVANDYIGGGVGERLCQSP
jgi:hypothetical protein